MLVFKVRQDETMDDASGPNPPRTLTDQQKGELLGATNQTSIGGALSWIAEGRRLRTHSHVGLYEALVAACDLGMLKASEALRKLTQNALRSNLDTSVELLRTADILTSAECDATLADLVAHSTSANLQDLTVGAFLAVIPKRPRAVEVYAQIAGLSWRDLKDRSAKSGITLPSTSSSDWSPDQLKAVKAIVNEVIIGAAAVHMAGALPARPIELIHSSNGNMAWTEVDAFHRGGVTYGQLLAQRIAGGTWSAHRNRTATDVWSLLVEQVTQRLDGGGHAYWSCGKFSPARVTKSFLFSKISPSGEGPGQLSIVTQGTSGEADLAIFVAIAHDGGTARKTAATLLNLPDAVNVDCVIVLSGQGWSGRSEVDGLIRAFGGRVFGDRSLGELVSFVNDRVAT